MTYRSSRATAFAVATICALQSSAVLAEEPSKSPERVQATALFNEGRALAKAGNYREACPKFEQSLRLSSGVGVQFNLADCWEHTGRIASAQALFQGAAASARAAGQTERADVAQARAGALNPRLIRLLLDVKASERGLIVRSNHVAVDPKLWGTAVSVDAGDYLIEASAPGKQPWSERVIIPAATTEVVSITIPPLGAAAPEAEVVPVAESKPSQPIEPVAPPPALSESDAKDARRTKYAIAFAGLGVVSVALGSVFAVEFKSKNNDAKSICPASVGCSNAEIDRHAQLLSDAKRFRTLSFVGFGVGTASLLTAGVLFLSPSSKSNRATWNATPFVTADGSWGAAATLHF